MKNTKNTKEKSAKVIDIHSRRPVEVVETVAEEVKPVKVKSTPASTYAKVLGLVVMITGITAYLVSQNYEFFAALIKTGASITVMGSPLCVAALVNSLVAETVLLCAAGFTCSRNWVIKGISWVLMVGMICGLGMFMHASLDNDFTGNSDYVQSLKQQKKDAVAAKDGYEEDKANLDPMIWKTRREVIQTKIDIERVNVVALDKKIAEAKDVSTGNLKPIIMYNTILRVTAMIINAMLAHTLMGFAAAPAKKRTKKNANLAKILMAKKAA